MNAFHNSLVFYPRLIHSIFSRYQQRDGAFISKTRTIAEFAVFGVSVLNDVDQSNYVDQSNCDKSEVTIHDGGVASYLRGMVLPD